MSFLDYFLFYEKVTEDSTWYFRKLQVPISSAGHCWGSKDELVSDGLLWTPAYGHSKAGWPAQTYIQQLCDDMGCNPEDLPEVMNDRETWRERARDIHASRTTWWWWWRRRQVPTLLVWLFGFYGISTFVGYLRPNPFLYK